MNKEDEFADVEFFDDGFGEWEPTEKMALVVEPAVETDDDAEKDAETELKDDAEEDVSWSEFTLPMVRQCMKKSLPQELLGKFAISIGSKSKRRCLHLLGACHRIPGLHYEDFEILDERPSDDNYHSHCGQ